MTDDATHQATAPRPTQRMGEAMRLAREARGLSMQAAGAAAGISSGYLFKLERGYIGSPSPRVLQRLSPALEIDYAELMDLAGYNLPRSAPAPRAGAADRRTRSLSDSTDDRDVLERIARALEDISGQLRRLHGDGTTARPPR